MRGMDDKNVYAIADGVVESVNAHGTAYGKHVCIKHSDGMVSLYAHLHLELHQGRYRYPAKGSSPLTEKDLVNAWAWIEDHVGGEYEMQEVKDLQVWSKSTGKAVIVKAVNVGGSNYVKLRDLEKLARVSVDFVDGKVYVD